MMRLSERDYETLGDLASANRNLTECDYRDGWAKPLDCGGSNGSHHGPTLVKLAKAGLADAKSYRPRRRRVWMYKINDAGMQVYREFRERSRLTNGER